MKRIGKIGRANINANRKCKNELEKRGITRCEVCGTDYALTIAHRKKRREYRGDLDGLSRWGEYLLLCQRCHTSIEFSKEKTEEAFLRLRYSPNTHIQNNT